jgi:hypothetical protein
MNKDLTGICTCWYSAELFCVPPPELVLYVRFTQSGAGVARAGAGRRRGQPLARAFSPARLPLNLLWSPTTGPEDVYCQMVWVFQPAGSAPGVDA